MNKKEKGEKVPSLPQDLQLPGEVEIEPPDTQRVVEEIPFKKTQIRLLQEIKRRQVEEFNDALQLIYEELGLTAQIKAQSAEFVLKQDLSGLQKFTYIKKKRKKKNKKGRK